MNVREAIETIGMQRLSELAGCTRTTIDRTKQKGALGSNPTQSRIRQAMRDQGLVLDGDVPTGGAQPDLPMAQPIISQLNDAKLRQTRAAAAEKERKNAEAERALVPVSEITAAYGYSTAQFRTGMDGARRELEMILCDECREAALAALDAAVTLTVKAVVDGLASTKSDP